jgi:hypothetical protein
MVMRIELYGQIYDQQCNLYYGEQLIYTGYVDDLVTSINGYLEVKLNYGTTRTLSVVVKKLGDVMFWVPVKYENLDELYKTIIISENDMQNIWNELGYDLADDMYLISNIGKVELKTLWIINSGIRAELSVVKDMGNLIKDNIILTICESSEDLNKVFNYLLESNWDSLDVKYLEPIDTIKEKLVVCLDYSNKYLEWIPVFKKTSQYNLINLGNGWGIRIENSISDSQ